MDKEFAYFRMVSQDPRWSTFYAAGARDLGTPQIAGFQTVEVTPEEYAREIIRLEEAHQRAIKDDEDFAIAHHVMGLDNQTTLQRLASHVRILA